jgi:hypothetical protein
VRQDWQADESFKVLLLHIGRLVRHRFERRQVFQRKFAWFAAFIKGDGIQVATMGDHPPPCVINNL